MSQAVFVPANVKTSLIQNRFLIVGDMFFANVSNIGYTQVTGVPFNLAGLAQTSAGTKHVTVRSANAAGVSAYAYQYRPDATGNIANGAVQIFTNGNLAAEVATGNLPSAVQNDVLVFEANINRNF